MTTMETETQELMCPFRAANHKVVVVVEESSELPKQKDSLIVLPDEVMERYQKGTEIGIVVDLGPECFSGFESGTRWFEKGEKVCFVKYAGIGKDYNGVHYRIMNDTDIYAVMNK